MLKVKGSKKKSKYHIARDFRRRKAWVEMLEARRQENIENLPVAEAVSTSAPLDTAPFIVKACSLPLVAMLDPEPYRSRAIFPGDAVKCKIEELPKVSKVNTTPYDIRSLPLVLTPMKVLSGLEPSLPLTPRVQVPQSPLRPRNNPITNVIRSVPVVSDFSDEVALSDIDDDIIDMRPGSPIFW